MLQIGKYPYCPSLIAIQQGTRIERLQTFPIEKPGMRLDEPRKNIHLRGTSYCGGDQPHPSNRDRRMIFFGMPERFCKSQDGFLHPAGGLSTIVGPDVVPCQPNMIRVVKFRIRVYAAFHPVREFRLR